MDCEHCTAYIVKSRRHYPLYCHWHAQRPAACSFFDRGDPHVAAPARAEQPACFGCDWCRFDAPAKARCLARFPQGMQSAPPIRQECELYLPRRWGHMDCPGCHSPLSVVTSELIACEQGHEFQRARGRVVTCTGCGAELHPHVYLSNEGPCDGWYKVTIHYCPRCGWGNFRTRYAGPAGARSAGGRRSQRAASRQRAGRYLTY